MLPRAKVANHPGPCCLSTQGSPPFHVIVVTELINIRQHHRLFSGASYFFKHSPKMFSKGSFLGVVLLSKIMIVFGKVALTQNHCGFTTILLYLSS